MREIEVDCGEVQSDSLTVWWLFSVCLDRFLSKRNQSDCF